jgi:hypothetical protein
MQYYKRLPSLFPRILTFKKGLLIRVPAKFFDPTSNQPLQSSSFNSSSKYFSQLQNFSKGPVLNACTGINLVQTVPVHPGADSGRLGIQRAYNVLVHEQK